MGERITPYNPVGKMGEKKQLQNRIRLKTPHTLQMDDKMFLASILPMEATTLHCPHLGRESMDQLAAYIHRREDALNIGTHHKVNVCVCVCVCEREREREIERERE